MTKIHFNGEWKTVEVIEQTPLLYVLRQQLDCQSVRFGCGSGHCGSCTVGLNGMAAQSCDTPLGAVENQSVETVDYLISGKIGSEVYQSFIDVQAAQCGYCISGILVTAAAFLENNPLPSDAQVREALDKHLCRCGSHNRIVRAVLRAADMMKDKATA